MINDKPSLLTQWSTIRWFMVVVLFSIGLLHVNFTEKTVQNTLFFAVFGGIAALNLLFQMQVFTHKKWVTIFQVILDIVFATIVVHLTGGLSSFFVWVYLIGVITASLTIPHNGGLLAGLVGSLSLMVLILLYQNGVLAPSQASQLDIAGSTVYVLSYTGLFCGVAMIASYLSDQLNLQKNLQKELQDLKEKQATLEESNNAWEDIIPVLKDVAHLDHDINTPLCVITLSLGRVKRYGNELQNEGLQKSNNEITEAVNKISLILQRLQALKRHPLVQKAREKEAAQHSQLAEQQSKTVKSATTPDMEKEEH
jgi:K+-sensing histidine kinase KdpD